MKTRFPLWIYLAASVTVVALAALAELAIGRKTWGISGQPGIWSSDVIRSHNSQYLFDPYTFSHFTHGILLYGLVWLVARNSSIGLRTVMAITIESVWEGVENTDMVIQRYRAATISQHYYGDSVMNSMCDILACIVGITLAAILPRRVTILLVIALELGLTLWIRDGLLLNILMLIHPIPALREWQSARSQ